MAPVVLRQHASLPCLCPGSTPGGRICFAELFQGVRFERKPALLLEAADMKHGAKMIGNGKGEHEAAEVLLWTQHGERNLTQNPERLFGVVALKRTAKSHRPELTLRQNGYGDISRHEKCKLILGSKQLQSGQGGLPGKKGGQKLAAPWASQAVPHHSTNQALGCLTSEVGRGIWCFQPGMAANEMKGGKVILKQGWQGKGREAFDTQSRGSGKGKGGKHSIPSPEGVVLAFCICFWTALCNLHRGSPKTSENVI